MSNYKDKNGKKLKIGHIVVIHGAQRYFPNFIIDNEFVDAKEYFYGKLGVVTGFGCVTIQTQKNESYHFYQKDLEIIDKL